LRCLDAITTSNWDCQLLWGGAAELGERKMKRLGPALGAVAALTLLAGCATNGDCYGGSYAGEYAYDAPYTYGYDYYDPYYDPYFYGAPYSSLGLGLGFGYYDYGRRVHRGGGFNRGATPGGGPQTGGAQRGGAQVGGAQVGGGAQTGGAPRATWRGRASMPRG
jgi:hypothetical protein